MVEWTRSLLGDISDAADGVIKTGPFGSQLHQADYVDDPEGIPVVMPKDIIDGRIVDDSIARVSRQTSDRLAIHRLKVGDIVMARRGDIGRRAMIDARTTAWLCGTGSLRISLTGSGIDPTYLYYFLGSGEAVGWLQGQAVGATMANLNTDIIRRMPVPTPPMSIQRKIAAVLAAYDELIENNLRRIEILEEMAQAVYREWFVEYRFPGYEEVEMVDSELGPIPDGCEVGSFKALASSARSHVHPSAEPETVFAHYSFAAFDAGRSPADDAGSDLRSGKLAVVEPSVLLAKLNPRIPRVWRVTPNPTRRNITSSEFLVLRPSARSSLSHLYCAIRELAGSGRLAAMAGGTSTSHQRLKVNDLETLDMLIPPTEMVHRFEETTGPMLSLVENLIRQNFNLTATRDLLLPKLVSGQIDVSDLDIDTEWLVA